jgi:CubicO group peptidase (beta-lactamase class C family)
VTVDRDRVQQLVDRLIAEHNVPGAVLGVFDGKETTAVASGIANRNTGAAMTPDTLFLTGSITKVWVTTIAMMLVEAGEIDLDAPVRTYLPEFRVADDEATRSITVRHLLTHSSGIDAADYIPDDLGRGAGNIAAYVSRTANMPQLYEPGAMWSYCNPGFVVVGRIIECLTGKPFDDAFRSLLIEPLGLDRTALTVEEAILHNTAIGHFPDPAGGQQKPTAGFLLPHALGPAGATLLTTVSDSLAFARLHVDQGVAADGTKLVGANVVAQMSAHEIDLPVPELGSSGLGWGRSDAPGALFLTHGGGSLGGQALMAVYPSAGTGFVAFANSAGGDRFLLTLRSEVFEMLGTPFPDAYTGEGDPAPAARFAGTYRRFGTDLEIAAEGDDLVVTITPTTDILKAYTGGRQTVVRLRAIGPHAIGFPASDGRPANALAFAVGDGDERPGFMFVGGRLHRRISP